MLPVAATLCLVLLVPATAGATSTLSTDAGGGFQLVDWANQDNDYAIVFDSARGQWVVFDYKGTVSTSGTSCIGRDFAGHPAAYCTTIPRLVIHANGGADQVRFRVASSDGAPAFTAPTVVNGGEGDDTVYGGMGADELNGGAGNDKLYGVGGGDRINGGSADDQILGGTGADDLDGGLGYDTVNNRDETARMAISLDNVANDGLADPAEGDNYHDTIEAVVGGRNKDTIVGADRDTDPNDSRPALIVGWDESDTIYPGRRSELIYADGDSAAPGKFDKVSYDTRQAPVAVSLNGAGDDGEVAAPGSVASVSSVDHTQAFVTSKEHDNIANGFENVELGQRDDNYYGPHAYDIPQTELPYFETAAQRIDLFGNAGNDSFYPGSTAENIHGEEGDADLTSYVLRDPSSAFTRVNISLDDLPNDGQAIDGPRMTRTALDLSLMFMASKLKLRRPVTLPELGQVDVVKVLIDDGVVVFRTITGEGTKWIARPGIQGLDLLRRVPELITWPSGAALKAQLRAIVVAFEKKLVELGNRAPAVFEWAPAFRSSLPWYQQSEADNVHSDIEQVQGSTNVSGSILGGVPVDTIVGNDGPNLVWGSPGPDEVHGLGGNDLIFGDLAGNPADDMLFGGSGSDWLMGGGGGDYLVGGLGTDALFGNDAKSAVDGAVDRFACGDLLLPLETDPETLADRGPFEGDVVSSDFATDHDQPSSICSGLGDSAGGTAATAEQTGGKLKVIAEPGRRNNLKIASVGSSVTVTDSKGFVDQVAGCCTGVTSIEIDSGDGKDVVDVSKVSASIAVSIATGAGNDKVIGSPGSDTIETASGRDKVKAAEGDDFVNGGTERDVLDGGAGSDTIDYSDRDGAIDVYLAQPSTKGNGATTQTLDDFNQDLRVALSLENDTLKWFENVNGGSGNDILQGNQLDNTLDGGSGVDAFSSGDGDDTVKSQDSTKDGSILCGPGQDRYRSDSYDPFNAANSSCETAF